MATAAMDGSHAKSRPAVAFEKGERPALVFSAISFFFIIGSFFVLRPLRDSLAQSSQIPNLLLFVFIVMLIATPAFGMVAARVPRKEVTPIVLLFFASHLLGFFAAFSLGVVAEDVAAVFFVWVGVFNLFAVAAFWVLMADIFRPDQAARLFAGISLGGTLGGIFLPFLASVWIKEIGIEGVFLISCAQVLLALFFALAARRSIQGSTPRNESDLPIGHEILSGVSNVLRSRYLIAIMLWVLIAHVLQTFSYLQQQELLQQALSDRTERFALLARIDAGTNAAAAFIQLFLAGRFIRLWGAGWALGAACIVATIGFVAFSALPVLAVAIAAQASFRAAYFGISLPIRHMLFSVVTLDEKYKSQSFIDTVVQRGADATGSGLFATLFRDDKLDLSTIAAHVAGLAVGWAMLGGLIGRMLQRRSAPERELTVGVNEHSAA